MKENPIPPEADLHIHTHCSDGIESPEEMILQAGKAGLACVAVTDHDTVDGVRPAMAKGAAIGVEVIPGIELSSSWQGRDIHLLAYCYDLDCPELVEYLIKVKKSRIERMVGMIEKLKGLGMPGITLEEVMAGAEDEASIGRPHLAKVMYERGLVRHTQEAFDRYLADDAPAFVAQFDCSPYETIALIRRAKGIPVLAHPMVTKVDQLIPSFIEAGLMGIEAYYPNNPRAIIDFYLGLAAKHRLLVTGGSDAHGGQHRATYVGKMRISYKHVEALKEAVSFRSVV
jgi:3',5'-nucleoside bisphosphate phosphatase